MRILFIALLTFAGISSALASTCQNPGIWDEGDFGQTDAGKMPKSANVTIGVGPLTRICGSLADPTNGVDMYEILVTGLFSATTSGRGANPIADPALFLFDETGHALLANDNACGCLQAGLFDVPLLPGLYFLAIAVNDQDPENKNGKLIFGNSFTGSTGPVLPQVANTNLDSWSGNGSATGQYLIDLTGAQFAQTPEPATIALIGSGLALLACRRRK
jgi:PEP-CTERM motif